MRKQNFFTILLLACSFSALSGQQAAPASLQVEVDSLLQVSRDFLSGGDPEQALKVSDQAEQMALSLPDGERSSLYGACCFHRARIYFQAGDLEEASRWFEKTREVLQAGVGSESKDYANATSYLAQVRMNLGDYPASETYFREASQILGRVLGEDDLEYHRGVLGFVTGLYRMGKLDLALQECLRVKEIMESYHLEKDPMYINCQNLLGSTYWNLGEYDLAEGAYLQVAELRAGLFGMDHPDYAGALINLGNLKHSLGKFEEAEDYYLRAIGIFQDKNGDRNHPFYMNVMNNLANMYADLANYARARQLLTEFVELLAEKFGKQHPRYAEGLMNLASVCTEMGDTRHAEELLLEAKDIVEQALGRTHPSFAEILSNLGVTYRELGRYAEAEPLLAESRTILEGVLGPDHPDVLGIVVNQANLYLDMEKPSIAEPLLVQVRTAFEERIGITDHPYYLNCLRAQVRLYSMTGEAQQTARVLEDMCLLSQDQLRSGLRYLSEDELAQYLQRFMESHDQTLVFTQGTEGKMGTGTSYDNSLFYKGFLQYSARELRRLATSHPEAGETYLNLQDAQATLAGLYSIPLAEREEGQVTEWEGRVQDLEKELARKVSRYGTANQQVHWQDVQATLENDEVAIEFVKFPAGTPDAPTVQYAALLLAPGTDSPRYIPLFEEAALAQILQASGTRKADYVNSLYLIADRGLVEDTGSDPSLYALIWARIEEAGLAGVKTIYFAPTGVLHRLNLGAIAVDEEQILADRYHLVRLNSTRQILTNSATRGDQVAKGWAVSFGGIDFEIDSLALDAEVAGEELLASRARGEGEVVAPEAVLRGGSWSYLKWTSREGKAVADILSGAGCQTKAFEGKEATEEVFKKLQQGEETSPAVIHLATHGFFFPDPGQLDEKEESVFKGSKDPMFRSGLILAGGNYAWRNGTPYHGKKEDGILTAYEISQMNLANTELVVLSACETGLGDIQGNEGVYGLQRAFKIAGARYLIMSLWQVPDRETMEFMTTFYRNWLPADAEAMAGKEEKMSIPDAFRKTQREMRDRFFNPYSWAGFVLVE